MKRFDQVLHPYVCTKFDTKNKCTIKKYNRNIWKIATYVTLNGLLWFGIAQLFLKYTSTDFQEKIAWFFAVSQFMSQLSLFSIFIFSISFLFDYVQSKKGKFIVLGTIIGLFIVFQVLVIGIEVLDDTAGIIAVVLIGVLSIFLASVYIVKIVRTKKILWKM